MLDACYTLESSIWPNLPTNSLHLSNCSEYSLSRVRTIVSYLNLIPFICRGTSQKKTTISVPRKTKRNKKTTPRKKTRTKTTFRTLSENLNSTRKTLLGQGRRERGQHLNREHKGGEGDHQPPKEIWVLWTRTNLQNELREEGRKVSSKRKSRRTWRCPLHRS